MIRSVATRAIGSIRTASPAASPANSKGERIADDPARITMRPTAEGTLPRAIAANGGPNGAPGQTARTRNPIASVGLAWNSSRRMTVTAGTST